MPTAIGQAMYAIAYINSARADHDRLRHAIDENAEPHRQQPSVLRYGLPLSVYSLELEALQ